MTNHLSIYILKRSQDSNRHTLTEMINIWQNYVCPRAQGKSSSAAGKQPHIPHPGVKHILIVIFLKKETHISESSLHCPSCDSPSLRSGFIPLLKPVPPFLSPQHLAPLASSLSLLSCPPFCPVLFNLLRPTPLEFFLSLTAFSEEQHTDLVPPS